MKINDIFPNKKNKSAMNTEKEPMENEIENAVNEVESATELSAEEQLQEELG